MPAIFLVVGKTAVNIHLETSFIDENIPDIFPLSKNVVPCSSMPFSILIPKTSNTDVDVSLPAASQATWARVTATNTEVELRVRKQTCIKPKYI